MASVKSIEVVEEGQAEVTKQESDHLAEIRALNKKFVEANLKWEILKDKTSAAKKFSDELGKELSGLISRGPDSQLELAFGGDGDQDSGADGDDEWEAVPIEKALALSASQLEKLEGAGVRTMGELEAFRADPGLSSIKGFGEKSITKIEEQILDWFDRRRDSEAVGMDDDDDSDEQDEPDEPDAGDLLEDM